MKSIPRVLKLRKNRLNHLFPPPTPARSAKLGGLLTRIHIKEYLKPLWQEAMRIPLRALSHNPSDETAWKLLFLLPSALLSRDSSRGGKSGAGEERKKFKNFLQFSWQRLLESKAQSQKKTKSQVNDRKILLRKVEAHASNGNISRASRLLTSNGLAPDSPHTLELLKEKHPEASNSNLHNLWDTSTEPSITLQRNVFLKALKSSPRGSAPGPSGLRFEHLKICAEVHDLEECLFNIAQRIASGSPELPIGQALAAARLIALPKGENSVRPIAIGEVLRRLVARTICLQEKSLMAEILSPTQYGVAVSGGLDLIFHQIQAGLEAHGDWGLFKCDLKNAFNSVAREAFFQEVSNNIPSILPFTKLLYGQPSPLIYKGSDGSTNTEIRSCQGVHQGDPLGPFYFCLAIPPVLKKLTENHKDLHVSAFFYDINLMGPPEWIESALPELVEGFKECGLQFQQQKSEIFHPDAASLKWAEGMVKSNEGTKLLGGAIGSRRYVNASYIDLVQDGADLLSGIKELQSTQCAFLMLRLCANVRLHHILCLSPPEDTSEAASLHDKAIKSTLANLLKMDHLPDLASKQASLRVRKGGLGLPKASELCHAAFVASWAATLQKLPERAPSLSEEVQLVTDEGSLTKTAQALRLSIDHLSTVISDLNLTPGNLQSAPQRFMAKLTTALDEAHHSSIRAESVQASRARLLSCTGSESGAWVLATPQTQHHVLSPEEFSSGVKLRLGLPIPQASGLVTCANTKCKTPIDNEGVHLLTCAKGPGRVRLHDRMVRVWHSAVLSTSLQANVEQRGLYSDGRRPDIVVPDFSEGRALHLDFSATHPCTPSNIAMSSNTTGAAAAKREREKILYSDCEGIFIPVVTEHHGTWGEEAQKLLKMLAHKAAESIPQITKAQYIDFWRKKLSCELLRASLATISGNRSGWHHYSNILNSYIDCISSHPTP